GAAGNGGEVDVKMTGNILTAGIGSYGIFAQSVGGGGGVSGSIAGNAKTVTIPALPTPVVLPSGNGLNLTTVDTPQTSFTIPSYVGLLTITTNGGNAGNGGVVNVTDNGNITTTGVGADGIFAQSIGGGGGLAGTSATSQIAFEGSNGGAGNGGTVTVNHTGNIWATGNDASAIFAQSVGGKVAPSGAAEIALYGQAVDSHGDAAPGTGSDIAVTVAGGIYEGGSDSGAGIWVDNGLVNTVTIAKDATVKALSGVAIKATVNSGLVVNTIDNWGTVAGDVLLGGTNANTVINETTGVLQPNTAIDLAGGMLTNKGLLQPGGSGNGVTVAVNGNFIQSATGTYDVDVGFGVSPSDTMNVTGNATVGGTISPHFTALMNVPDVLLTAAGNLTDNGAATVGNTVVVHFSLDFGVHTLTLVPSANFAPAGLTGNESAVGGAFQSVWNAGGALPLASFMGYLGNITDLGSYESALDRLHPEPYLAEVVGLQSTESNFFDNLMSCHTSTGALAPVEEEDCNWGEISFGGENADRTAQYMGFSASERRVQVGRQQRINANWVIGASAAYQEWDGWVDNRADLSGRGFALGAVAKYLQGPWVNAVAFSFAYDGFHGTRFIGLPTANVVADGSSHTIFAGLHGRSTYLFDLDDFYVKPYADLDLGYYKMADFRETNAGVIGLNVNGTNQFVATLSPHVEVGTTQIENGGYLRPFVNAGLNVASNGRWNVSSDFQGAPSQSEFTASTPSRDVSEQIGGGLEYFSNAGFELHFQFNQRFASHYSAWDGFAKFALKF
ncbi:MAG: autotransporter domain-containing protein, partial [Alphaproteobacteria bacterium]|nr:autotransporter domain-containing protein [Alphaproteobacteria bacterium]